MKAVKRNLILIGIFFLVLFFPKAPCTASENFNLAPSVAPQNENTDKELVVFFKSRPSTRTLMDLSRQSDKITIKAGLANTNAMVIEAEEQDQSLVLDLVKNNPQVEAVTANSQFIPFAIPNDPGVAAPAVPDRPRTQWNFFNAKFAAEGRSAWDLGTGSSEVKIAVIDSGVDSAHEDLSGKLSLLVDCTASPCQVVSSMRADPENGTASHGTHVAGLVAAATNNGKGMAGSGYNSKIIFIKVMDSEQRIRFTYLINALNWAADHQVRVANMSIGQLEENLDQAVINQVQEAVRYAWGKGMLLVASAGNCGGNTQGNSSCQIIDDPGHYATNTRVYPAACEHVLSVASLTYQNQLAPYSQHNDVEAGNWISVAAPGGNCTSQEDKYYCIASTWPGNQYRYSAGTSMAAPQVAGLAALLLGQSPNLTNAQVKQIIENTADESIGAGATNFGAIDALAALESLSAGITPTLTPTPTPTVPAPTPSVTQAPAATATPTPSSPPSATDYNQWRDEYTGRFASQNSDYNHDGVVNLLDYEILRRRQNP